MAEKIKIPIELEDKGVTKTLNEVNEGLDKTQKSGAKAGKSFSAMGKATNTAKKGLGEVAKLLKGGLFAGIAMSALDGLKGAFASSQKGADMMAKAQITLEAAFREVINVLEPLFDLLGKLFKDPLQSLKDFGNFLAENIYNRFEGLVLLIPRLGNAIKLLFKGEFKEAGKVALNSVAQVATGLEDTLGTVTNAYNEIGKAASKVYNASKKAFDQSDAIIKARKNAERLAITYQGIVEKYDLLAEKQRQIRDDESVTIGERIKANEELAKVLDEGLQKEKENIKGRMAAKQLELNLDKKNLGLQNEILALQQELTGVDAKYAGLKSEQLTNINSLNKEAIELQKSLANGQLEADKIILQSQIDRYAGDLEQFDLRKQLMDEEFKRKQEQLDAELSQLKEGTQAYVDATNEKKILDAQYNADAQKLSEERVKFLGEAAEAELEIERELQQQKIDAVLGALSGVQSLVGEDSAFGKALAISQAIINTYTGASKALAQGGVFGAVAAAGVVASGLAQVRTIASTELPTAPMGSTGGTSTPSATAAPSVGIIQGQMSQSNQLQADLNRQMSKPTRAYVVGQNVTSQQSLDRHILENATL